MESKPQEDQKDGGKKDWAEMSDEEAAENDQKEEEQAAKVQEPPKKVYPPAQKGTKNKQGDYVVNKLEIIEFKSDTKKKE